MLLALLLTLVATAHADALGSVAWHWPLRGEVIAPFHLTPNPFARGQHRGIDIAAPPGATVRSACAGRVSFAGRLPGREHVASVVCGPLVATYLELGSLAVRRDATVRTGAPIGTVAASHLQLGARRITDRHGYVDPLTLLRAPAPPPLGATPRGGTDRRPRAAPPQFAPAPHPRPSALPRPLPPTHRPRRAPVASPAPSGVPLPAWFGLALFAAGTPLGALVRRRRRAARLDLRTADEGA
ncbi:MAG TPA: M23 family metallopeptidase [Solirubrobacteraceae bacterium]|jgi:hypothetical protein